MGEFEEFKQAIKNLIQYREEIPEGVINIITEIFGKIQEIYERNGCANSSILEGMNLELEGLRRVISDMVADSRRDDHFTEVMAVFNKMEQQLEEIEQAKETIPEEELQDMQSRNNNQDREGFAQIGSNNGQIVRMIMDRVEETLMDIRSRQSRILYNRGQLSDAAIEEIQYEVLSAIRRFQDRDQDIFELLKQDDRTLRDAILEKYEEYIQYKAQSEKSEADKFRESLNAGISLEEQANSAKQILDSQKQDTDKPKLLVDELPDLFL